MALILKQAAPAATTATDLFTATAGTICSSILICNRDAGADTFRVSISVGGAATTDKDYLYYDIPVTGNNTFVATIGITLNIDDVVRVYSTSGSCSFTLFGKEA